MDVSPSASLRTCVFDQDLKSRSTMLQLGCEIVKCGL